MKKMISYFKSLDYEQLEEIPETNLERRIRFCLLYEEEDVFLQLVFNGDIEMETFLQYEGEMLNLFRELYAAALGGEILAIPTCMGKLVYTNPYAKRTMSFREQRKLQKCLFHCVSIQNVDELLLLVKAACRCVGQGYFYFEALDLFLIVDEIGGVFVGEQYQILGFLETLKVPYEIND